MLLRVEVSRELRLGLEAQDLIGFERSAVDAERELRPEIWAGLLEAYQDAVLDAVCGARRAPLTRGRRAPFRCPACNRERGFRRRGRRSRRRVLLTRLGRMQLSLAQVGCRCGRRFAPLLQLLGVERGSRVSPGLARRAAELATELPFASAAEQLLAETGHGPSAATVRRIVARAGERCDLTVPRNDLGEVAAMLIDGTRVPAGCRFGRRAHSARGVEVNIACAVMGRDVTGRRPRASIELLGASIAQPWLSLHDAVRSPKGIGIVVTDGDNGIEHLLDRALPEVLDSTAPSTCSTTSGCGCGRTGSPSRIGRRSRIGCSPRSFALPPGGPAFGRSRSRSPWPEDHDFNHAAQHLRDVGPLLSTWQAVRHSRRPWRMNGRSRPEHTTACWNGPCGRSTAGSIPPATGGSSQGCVRW